MTNADKFLGHWPGCGVRLGLACNCVEIKGSPPESDPTPLDVYPIELHRRTLHALITAQLVAGTVLRSDQDSREAQLRHFAAVATKIMEYSRDETLDT